ncbi:MAG: peptidyl-prolyl cis-trans isomerase [Acidobacteria bacterium]|nr:peptidyl-prolyl cis-trans isomerase [Acidobacteriota bacterium]
MRNLSLEDGTPNLSTSLGMKHAFLLLLLLSFAVTACRHKSDGSPVLASVNGRTITRVEFDRFVTLKLGDTVTGEMNDALRSQILDEYLLRQLVIDEATRTGLSVSDTEVEKVTQENPQLRSTASDAAGRKELENDLLVEKYYQQKVLRNLSVSPEEIEAYIEANKDRLTSKPGFYVREIRVPTRAEAEAARRDIVEGKQAFVKVARAYSHSQKTEQGELTHYDEGQLPDVLEEAIKPLSVGSVSPVVQSNYGFHLFLLERRTQPYAPGERRSQLDDRRLHLRDELISRRNQEAVDTAVNRLAATAKIKIDDAALGFTYQGKFRHN